ncbi:hypothetical protein NCER_101351 [Vairimorpha ceranae BRL01]|uniref:Uncharacterized protein n=2 Tax=Vairimorpha ceranae TaxID=40302 RepID=C4V9T7_VAIC1|nr:hypothetical protein AAJ76_300010520 [Vairimorpha ceranae]EEQ82019.1 hypothetical protein NCER_101351 [Vairimorpha ceranae BRL01]KKO76388.1 hypothetical protein AAJ76_300010520 [Vairimorpha ceranae]
MKKNKQHVLNYLFNKLDNIKLELYDIYKYNERRRIYFDFEKNLRIVGHENKLCVREKEKVQIQENCILEVKKYLHEIKLVPINKILTQTHKIIFYDEYLYFYKEADILKYNFLKQSRKNKIISETEVDPNESKLKIEQEIENIDTPYIKQMKFKFNSELKRYLIFKNIVYNDIVNLHLKSCLNAYFFLAKIDGKKIIYEPEVSSYSKYSYKEKLNLFKECKSKSSIFYKFTKSSHSTGVHLSFKKITEKLNYKSVRDICKNIIREDDIQKVEDNSSFQHNTNSKTHEEYNEHKPQENHEECFGHDDQSGSVQSFDVRYPFYNNSKE